MFSIRAFARSAPRAISRLATSSVLRPAARPSLLRAAWQPSKTKFAATFSSSGVQRATEGEVDEELIAKFTSELEMEQEMNEENEVPTSVKDYLENGPFEIQDVPGLEEVVLTRTFGDEIIKVTFSIADLHNIDPEADYEDRALADEDVDSDAIKQVPEDSIEETEEGQGTEGEESFPVRVNVIIEKPGKGAIAVESVAQDGMIAIDNVYYYSDAKYAHAKTAEADHSRRNMFVGPPFGQLDPDLQVMFERYLDERGINTALALFVPDYIDVKEQREYLSWLENVKSFVEA